MSVFAKIAFPMFCVGFTMLYLARKKFDKHYLIPAYFLLAFAFVNAALAITSG